MKAARRFRFAEPSALPGLRLTLAFTLIYLAFFLIVPLAALAVRPWEAGWRHAVDILFDDRTLAALRLSFGAALMAACVNAVFGTITAWVLVRYRFPGRKLLDAFVDLPFALPTAVAGISLAAIYAPNGAIGSLFAPYNIHIAFTPIGVWIALVFVGFPFVTRSIQPVLEDMGPELEEAAATLGASRLRTIVHVVAPAILPALLAGFSLALARAVGEYGSVIFIAGNIPKISEIAPLLIVIRLEEFDYAGASVVGLAMLALSLLMLLSLNAAQAMLARRSRP